MNAALQTPGLLEKIAELEGIQNNDYLIIEVIGQINAMVGMAQSLVGGGNTDSKEYLLATLTEASHKAIFSTLQLRVGYEATEDALREMRVELSRETPEKSAKSEAAQ